MKQVPCWGLTQLDTTIKNVVYKVTLDLCTPGVRHPCASLLHTAGNNKQLT